MSAARLDGKACAADLEERLKQRIAACSVQPHLAVIIVGNDPASHVYVNKKFVHVNDLASVHTHRTVRRYRTIGCCGPHSCHERAE